MKHTLYLVLRKIYRIIFPNGLPIANIRAWKVVIDTNQVYKHSPLAEQKHKRLCIFSSYDRNGIIHDYVIYYLAELKKIGVDTIFVTTSPVCEEEEIRKIKPYIDSYIHRKNVGYDFGSWKTGLLSTEYLKYEKIIFANDSVF